MMPCPMVGACFLWIAYLKKNGFNPARIGPLERLTYINTHAMGALSFEPSATELALTENIPLIKLAQEVQEVLKGEGAEFLQHLLIMGGSPQGARPKALISESLVSDKPGTVQLCKSYLVQ